MTDQQRNLPLYLSAPSPCSYLDNLDSNSAFLDPECDIDMQLYGHLIKQGFRRSGRLVYRPHCETCNQCLSVRIPVERFTPRRRHRRTLANNSHVEIRMTNAGFHQEHFSLYQKYTASRHTGGSMAESSKEEYLGFLTASWGETHFIEMRENGKLLGVAVTDQVNDGLSAVYTFFDPDYPQRSLGNYGVLMQISLTRQLNLPYLYLGYWIRDCKKMSYKADYRPLEIYSHGKWRSFQHGQTIELPELPKKTIS